MTDIIVGVDESERAAAALRWAVAEGALHGWKVRAIMAWDFVDQHHFDDAFDPGYDQTTAEQVLLKAVVRAVGADAVRDIERLAVPRTPARALVEASATARLLVVGARGAGGLATLMLGSVSDQLLHHALSPIAIVHEPPPAPPKGRVLVGVDGSERAQGALQWAITEARRRDAVVEVLHAWRLPVTAGAYAGVTVDPTLAAEAGQEVLDRAIEQEDTGDVAVEPRLGCGPAARVLVDAAAGADLVVVGSRGLGGFKSLLLGSVSRHLAHHAPGPVVVT